MPGAPPVPEVVAPPAPPAPVVAPEAPPEPVVAEVPLEPVVEPVAVVALVVPDAVVVDPAPLVDPDAPVDVELVASPVPPLGFELEPDEPVPHAGRTQRIAAVDQERALNMEKPPSPTRATIGSTWSRCQVALPNR
jgi:hypothetical protein